MAQNAVRGAEDYSLRAQHAANVVAGGGAHLARHRGVVGADGNERGRDAGARRSHIHACGRNADALGRDVDALHNSSHDIM